MSIVQQTKKVMQNAIMRYAKENEIANSDSQILISTDNPDCIPSYQVLKENKPYKDVTFSDILNVKIDFLGRELIATTFIKNCIKRLTKEFNCNYNDVNVLIYPMDNSCNKIKVYLFIGTSPTKELSFDYIFGED